MVSVVYPLSTIGHCNHYSGKRASDVHLAVEPIRWVNNFMDVFKQMFCMIEDVLFFQDF